MELAFLLVFLAILLAMGVPVAFSLGVSSLATFLLLDIPPIVALQRMAVHSHRVYIPLRVGESVSVGSEAVSVSSPVAAPTLAVDGEVRMSSAVTSSMTRSALASSSSLGRWSANNSTMICRSVFPTPAGRRSTGRPRTLPTACACRSRVAGACVTRVPSMSHRMRTSAKSLTRAR